MKYVLILNAFLVLNALSYKKSCNKLPNGSYLVHFTGGHFEDYHLRTIDNYFVQYFDHDSASGKINWIYDCIFEMEFFRKNKDSVSGPLRILYESWGEPCIELNEVKGDTIRFRTTHSRNLHITINEGYFLRIPLG